MAEYAAAFDKSSLLTPSNPKMGIKCSCKRQNVYFLALFGGYQQTIGLLQEGLIRCKRQKVRFFVEKVLGNSIFKDFSSMSWWFRFLVAQKYESLVTYIQ